MKSIRRTAATAVLTVAATLGAVIASTVPAGGVAPVAAPHPTQVNALPTNTTPHATNGSVRTVAVAGGTVFMGGDFTAAENPDRTPVARSWILAFDKATGVIRTGWAPQLDGMVHSIVPAADGQSVYVGGAFTNINGVRQPKVARLRVSDGAVLPFKPAVDATVTTMALVGDRLWLGGVFKNIQGRALRVAAVDAQTAVIDDRMNIPVTGTHHGVGQGKIWRIEPSPDGRHVLIGGSFSAVGGQPRGQIAKIDIAADGTPSLSPWSTTRYAPTCASSVEDSLRDISYSPDGSYFVIGTSGGLPGNNDTLCDTTARWEESSTPNAQPTWVNPTGGDSVYSVEVSGAAVYIGGHFRWSNNVNGRDSKQPGAVDREGIAALDPANGVPLSWNPGRDRGQAVWQMLSTPDGLYVASDTDRIARYLYRGRIAFFPVTGGLPVPQPGPLVLPSSFHQWVPQQGPTAARVVSRSYDGTTFGPPATVAAAVPSDLSTLRGAFVAEGNLYTAHSDGTLKVRSYDGTTFGAPTTINLNGLTSFANDLRDLRAMTWSAGRLLYSTSTSSTLYSRGFSLESRIVGGSRTSVASSSTGTLHYGNLGSLVVIGGDAYYTDTRDGALRRGPWSPTSGITAAAVTTVSSSGPGGVAWNTGELWGVQGAIPNQPPTASFTATCTGLTCSVDASGSTDGDGTVTGVQWAFGDGGTGTGTTASRRYATAGTYTITATVTDDDGATSSTTRSVTVTGPQVVATASSAGATTKATHTVTVPAGVQPGDQLVLFAASNAPGTTSVSTPAGWTRVADVPTSGSRHDAFVRTAVAGDAGATISVTLGTAAKADLTLAAYRGVTLGASAGQAGYTTPTVAATPGAWAVSYWADKSATTTGITPPAGTTVRFQRAGTGAGHLTEALADTVATGTTVGGLTGTPVGGAPVANAAAVTVVLIPS